MKRLNPSTNLLFKRGDIREDGMIFFAYSCKYKNGKLIYVYERWFDKDKFEFEKSKLKTLGIKDHKKRRNNPKSRAMILFRDMVRRANKSEALVEIDIPWIQNKIEKGFCELTGLPFDLDVLKGNTTNPYAPSIDRIDPKNRNYSLNNCRLVLCFVNRALNEYTEDQSLPILEAMVNSIKERYTND